MPCRDRGRDGHPAPVRLWLLADRARVLVLVWDASPLPPVPVSTSEDAENGRGLLLVDAISERWGFVLPRRAWPRIRPQVSAERSCGPQLRG